MVMMVVSFILIPNPWCSLWVGLSIVSIEVGVVGYMTMWGVSLDSISMINLIMCIGFSVDFSAHISYAYLTAKVDTPDERVKECLFTLGLPILQGGLSTILGVIALTFAPSYIFVTFFKIVFLVIFFGIMHGIFLLPVLLSLVGPGSFKKRKEPKLYDPNKVTMPKGDIEPQSLCLSEKKINSKMTHKEVQTNEKAISQSKSILPQTVTHLPSEKYTENAEKDMGIGTSGEDSSEGSFQDGDESNFGCNSVVETENKPKRQQKDLLIKEVYNNRGYVSDVDKDETHRRHTHYQQSGRRAKHPQQWELIHMNGYRKQQENRISPRECKASRTNQSGRNNL